MMLNRTKDKRMRQSSLGLGILFVAASSRALAQAPSAPPVATPAGAESAAPATPDTSAPAPATAEAASAPIGPPVVAAPVVPPPAPVPAAPPVAAPPADPLAGFSNGTAFLKAPDDGFVLLPSGRLHLDGTFSRPAPRARPRTRS
jgi:hypothetical protein